MIDGPSRNASGPPSEHLDDHGDDEGAGQTEEQVPQNVPLMIVDGDRLGVGLGIGGGAEPILEILEPRTTPGSLMSVVFSHGETLPVPTGRPWDRWSR